MAGAHDARRIRTLLEAAEAQLEQAAVPSAGWDAERLLRHVLGWERARIVSDPLAVVSPGDAARFRQLVSRRAEREPLQHIVGTQEFWRDAFEVSPDALIPRPETEILVEEALRLIGDLQAPRILDVGTGSGAIALSLARERPDARVLACDVSPSAIALAARNAGRLARAERVAFVVADLLDAFRSAADFDLIVSNPPYVARDAAEQLSAEVRDHEPAAALFGGADGLDAYRRLVPQLPARLRGGGYVALEIGLGQEAAVRELCAAAGLQVERVIPDLQSIPRVLVASRAR